ncbi:hypothetical protein HWI79_1217 [Cryptosporidium felis]|nr:hypothetical protein HWI79_1217 [Cryptosporidium felis]
MNPWFDSIGILTLEAGNAAFPLKLREVIIGINPCNFLVRSRLDERDISVCDVLWENASIMRSFRYWRLSKDRYEPMSRFSYHRSMGNWERGSGFVFLQAKLLRCQDTRRLFSLRNEPRLYGTTSDVKDIWELGEVFGTSEQNHMWFRTFPILHKPDASFAEHSFLCEQLSELKRSNFRPRSPHGPSRLKQ